MSTISTLFLLYIAHQTLPSVIFWVATIAWFSFLWFYASTGMTLRRKLSIASWSPPSEGTIHVSSSIEMTKANHFINEFRQKTNKKLTITHLVGKAVGMALSTAPDLNGRIVFGRYVPHKDVSVCFLVALEDGKNLAKVTIKDIHKKSFEKISEELEASADKLRKGNDADFKKTMNTLRLLPTWVIRPLSQVTGTLSSMIGANIPALGITKFPFGSCVVTNVGMFGMEEAYAPFTSFFHVPLLILIGQLADKPVVVEKKIEIRPILKINGTVDHRYVDGKQGSVLVNRIKELLENPDLMVEKFD
eukprot:TRINITY_DN10351_c0_g1_i1.p1 TRINITY_DN10351_c0_g1~~TRINITY_DN10351_c0_g1_i1.p1  ORF type:complete len:314 (+),score=62.16 TRINITY_DN10351_c0_g1_i1:32-943(+)